MAGFREFPWYIQVLIFLFLAVAIVGVGEFVPFLPLQQARANLEQAHNEQTKLEQEVNALRVYERRSAEFRTEMEALQKQLETLKSIVPEEKELDEFMRLLQASAAAAGVQIRSLKAQPVVPRSFHYEMPFEVQVDGPYYSILDFFSRLSRLSRIINIGDISFSGLGEGKAAKYPMRPGTTVTGTFTATTFFTKSTEAPVTAGAGKQPGAR